MSCLFLLYSAATSGRTVESSNGHERSQVSRSVTRFVPRDAPHAVFGPDALMPDFVAAARDVAKTAPEVNYDGEAFVCGEIRILSARPHDTAIAAMTRRHWVVKQLEPQGFLCSGAHVEEALWNTSVRGMRVR